VAARPSHSGFRYVEANELFDAERRRTQAALSLTPSLTQESHRNQLVDRQRLMPCHSCAAIGSIASTLVEQLETAEVLHGAKDPLEEGR
jgi:hypothetical protein